MKICDGRRMGFPGWTKSGRLRNSIQLNRMLRFLAVTVERAFGVETILNRSENGTVFIVGR